jgi:hypothetical protein
MVALNQVDIAASLGDHPLHGRWPGPLALALALAFGLYGREPAGRLWRQWYRTPAPVVAGGGGGGGGSMAGGNGGDRAPVRDDRREGAGWRRSAVSKLQEAREAVARDQADPGLTWSWTTSSLASRITAGKTAPTTHRSKAQAKGAGGPARSRPSVPRRRAGLCPPRIGHFPYLVVLLYPENASLCSWEFDISWLSL